MIPSNPNLSDVEGVYIIVEIFSITHLLWHSPARASRLKFTQLSTSRFALVCFTVSGVGDLAAHTLGPPSLATSGSSRTRTSFRGAGVLVTRKDEH